MHIHLHLFISTHTHECIHRNTWTQTEKYIHTNIQIHTNKRDIQVFYILKWRYSQMCMLTQILTHKHTYTGTQNIQTFINTLISRYVDIHIHTRTHTHIHLLTYIYLEKKKSKGTLTKQIENKHTSNHT